MKTIKVATLAKRINNVEHLKEGDIMEKKPIKDFDVTITIGITGVDESDVENQLDFILNNLDYDELNYNIKIEEVGEYK